MIRNNLGNTFSDAIGVGAAGYIEKFSTGYMGMKTPDLNVHEQNTSRVSVFTTVGLNLL